VRHTGETELTQGESQPYFFAMPLDLNGARVAPSETGDLVLPLHRSTNIHTIAWKR